MNYLCTIIIKQSTMKPKFFVKFAESNIFKSVPYIDYENFLMMGIFYNAVIACYPFSEGYKLELSFTEHFV